MTAERIILCTSQAVHRQYVYSDRYAPVIASRCYRQVNTKSMGRYLVVQTENLHDTSIRIARKSIAF